MTSQTIIKKEACHIVLRFNRFTTFEGQRLDSIIEHNSVLENYGKVALAKFGRSPAKSRVTMLKDQIKSGIETRIYLVTRSKKEYEFFSAPITELYAQDEDSHIDAIAPEYYRDCEFIPGLWIVFTSPLKTSSIKDLRLVLNGKPLVDVLGECRTSMMLVNATT